MRCRALAAAAILGATTILSSCQNGTSTAPSQPEPTSTPVSLAAGSQACVPKEHPAGKIIEIATVPAPWDVAVRDDGLTYFTEIFNNGVGITNTATRTVTGFIPTGATPTGIAFSPDGLRAYTANQGDNTVSVIDVTSAQVIATLSTGGSSPFAVQVSPDGSLLYVGNNDNTLLVVDTQTLQITKTVFVGFATNSFAVDPAGRMLYANHFFSGSVSEIDIFTGTVLRTFNLGGAVQGMALNKKGTHLFVANEGGYLSEVVLSTGQTNPNIPLAGVGFGVGVTPDDNEAWVTLPLNGKVQIFKLQSRQIKGTLNVGGEPRRVAFSQQGKIGAITNMHGYITFVR